MIKKILLVVCISIQLCTLFAETREDEVRRIILEYSKPPSDGTEFDNIENLLSEKLKSIHMLNLGSKKGETWLGVWTQIENTALSLRVYLIRDDKVIQKNYRFPGIESDFVDAYGNDWNYYRGSELEKQIERFRITEGTGFIYDFNRDGKDEILEIAIGGQSYAYEILTFDPVTCKEKYLFGLYPKFNDTQTCPLEFATYNGQRGIKVNEEERRETGEYDEVFNDPLYEVHQEWAFYAWNESVGRYTKVEGIPQEELENLHGGAEYFANDVPVVLENDNKPEEAKSADMNEKEIKETNETNGANESNEAIGMNRITILITILGVIVLCGIVIKLGKKKRS